MKKKYALLEIVYVLPTVWFCIALKRLNSILQSMSFPSNLSLLYYDDYKPLKFFLGAVLLDFIGVCLCCYYHNEIKYGSLYFSEVLFLIAFMCLDIFFAIWIFALIDNPILRAIIAVLGGIAVITNLSKA